MKSLTKTIEFNGRDVVVRELTVSDIREWMADMRKGEYDLVDVALLENCNVNDFTRFTDLSPEEIDSFTPSQLRLLEDECRQVNVDFFGMRERMVTLGKSITFQTFPEPSAH